MMPFFFSFLIITVKGVGDVVRCGFMSCHVK